MKLAILGRTPLALETALRFHFHGAALTLFTHEENVAFDSCSFNSADFTSDLGLGVLKELGLKYSPSLFKWSEWESSYAKPIFDYLRAHQEVRSDEVVSITKRFLSPGEAISGRSRFLDLFRIIYKVDPRDFIEEQKDTNPETYEKLTNEFVNSLASSIEMYQDYDLVIDLRHDLSKASASVSGRALGEGRSMDKAHYALNALAEAKTLVPSPDLREMALIGSDSLSAEILLSLEEWLKEPRSRLFVVSTEEEPFEKFLSEAHVQTKEKLLGLLSFMESEFQKEIDVFTTKLREWQGLDDFVQAKIPRPGEPIPRLVFFSGHNVTAMDELIDRKRLFLTLEKPEFRNGKKQPENNLVELKTIGVDRILVSHGKKNTSVIQVDKDEVGFFSITPLRLNMRDVWNADLKKIEGIEDEIFKLFSPVDSH